MDDFELPPDLPYEAVREGDHNTRTCDFCEKPELKCHAYTVRYPNDPVFLAWENKNKSYKSGARNLAYIAIEAGSSATGFFCSEMCALKAYFPSFAVFRMTGR